MLRQGTSYFRHVCVAGTLQHDAGVLSTDAERCCFVMFANPELVPISATTNHNLMATDLPGNRTQCQG